MEKKGKYGVVLPREKREAGSSNFQPAASVTAVNHQSMSNSQKS